MPFKQVLDPATGEMVWEKMSANEAAAAAVAKAAQMPTSASKPATDAALSSSSSRTTRNIVYAQVPVAPSAGAADEKDAAAPSVLDLKLDAYLPPVTSCTSPQGVPAVVLIHGTCSTVQQCSVHGGLDDRWR